MSPPALGMIVPCRDEAVVIERKLANLARVDWPSAARPHRIVVVDDGSRDGTAELARAAAQRHCAGRDDLRVEVLASSEPAGKAGAIACGLAALADSAELVVLTDADVVLERPALVELAAAFARRPELGLACGAQRFVDELSPDGDPERAHGDASGAYDRWTAVVRRLESRAGRLFSVHGQLLAWRRELALAATAGLAADDIDLRLQARARGARVELVPRARFLEVKAPLGEARRAQALRRARAFVQCVRSARAAEIVDGLDLLDRVQFACYRALPLAAPWLVPLALLAAPLAAWTLGAPRLAAALVVVGALLVASPLGRRLAALLALIVRAAREERRGTLSGAWSTARR